MDFVVGMFWLSMVTFAVAIVLHIQHGADKKVSDEHEKFELDLDSEADQQKTDKSGLQGNCSDNRDVKHE